MKQLLPLLLILLLTSCNLDATPPGTVEPTTVLPTSLPSPVFTPIAAPTPTQPPWAACLPTNTLVQQAEVTEVVDGDTIHVDIDGQDLRVRYIGVDTPERDMPFYEDATDFNAALVEGQIVTLVKDVSETDRYDRLLRYIFVGDTFINYELVRQGYAVSVTFPPDVACAEVFGEAERLAREEGLGLWGEP